MSILTSNYDFFSIRLVSAVYFTKESIWINTCTYSPDRIFFVTGFGLYTTVFMVFDIFTLKNLAKILQSHYSKKLE